MMSDGPNSENRSIDVPPGDDNQSPQSASGDTAAEQIAHIGFRGKRLEAFRNENGLDLRPGDFVIVEAERGVDLGRVATCDGCELKRRRNQPLRRIQRHATPEEIARIPILRQEDKDALDICRGRAEHFNLEMKVIDAETQFDGNRVTFYFTAEHRVDFRELVRDLASIFRTRIELRQVGARDAARRCDGIGPCGKQLCCTSCLRDFEPVTLKMAKEQNLSLNPAKISGSCGRLMCCLVYECNDYQTAQGHAPGIGSIWRYNGRLWRINSLDIGNHRLFIENKDEEVEIVDLDLFREEAEFESDGRSNREKPETTDD